MGTRTIMMGTFKSADDPEAAGEKRALNVMLRQLGVEGVSARFETVSSHGNTQLFAHVNWQTESDTDDLKLGRRIDKILSKFDKGG